MSTAPAPSGARWSCSTSVARPQKAEGEDSSRGNPRHLRRQEPRAGHQAQGQGGPEVRRPGGPAEGHPAAGGDGVPRGHPFAAGPLHHQCRAADHRRRREGARLRPHPCPGPGGGRAGPDLPPPDRPGQLLGSAIAGSAAPRRCLRDGPGRAPGRAGRGLHPRSRKEAGAPRSGGAAGRPTDRSPGPPLPRGHGRRREVRRPAGAGLPGHPEAREPILRLLTAPETARRVQTAALAALADSGFGVQGYREKVESLLGEPFFIDRAGIVKRRGAAGAPQAG